MSLEDHIQALGESMMRTFLPLCFFQGWLCKGSVGKNEAAGLTDYTSQGI